MNNLRRILMDRTVRVRQQGRTKIDHYYNLVGGWRDEGTSATANSSHPSPSRGRSFAHA